MSDHSESEGGCLLYGGIAAAWLAIWYVVLSGNYSSSTSGLRHCGFLEFGSCRGPWSEASSAFNSGMLIALISIPLPIYLVKRLRRGLRDQAVQAEIRREREAQRANSARAQKNIHAMAQKADDERSRVRRADFVERLGAVNGYLELLPHQHDTAAQLDIRQRIATELGKLLAAYTLDEIASLLRADETIRIKVEFMLTAMRNAGVNSADAAVIERALSM